MQNSSGTKITENGDDGPSSNFRIVYIADPGTYYCKVTEYFSETGSYVVQATLEPGQLVTDVGDTRETAATLALGTSYPAYIAPIDDVDYFRIVVDESGELTAWTTGDTDTVGELQTDDGTVLDKVDDDSGNNYNFRIVYNVRPGTYYLKVTEAQGNDNGSYVVQATLALGQLVADVGDTRETAATLALGTPYPAYIAPIDDVDYFRIVVDESGELTAWTIGDTDTVGELQTDDGTVLGRDDDDSGNNYNFRLVYTVEPGTYYLKVTK